MKEELIALLKTFEPYGITSTLEKNEDLENHYQLTFKYTAEINTLFEAAAIQIFDTLNVEYLIQNYSITTAVEEMTFPVLILNFKSISKLFEPAPAAPSNTVEEKEVKEVKEDSASVEPEKMIHVVENFELPEAVLEALRELDEHSGQFEEDSAEGCQTNLKLKINSLDDILDRDSIIEDKQNASYVQAAKTTVKKSYQATKNVFFNHYLNSSPTAVWLRGQLAPFKANIDGTFSPDELSELSKLLDVRQKHVPTLREKATKAGDEKTAKRYTGELSLLFEMQKIILQLLCTSKVDDKHDGRIQDEKSDQEPRPSPM